MLLKKQKLSGSTDGKGILIVATASPGTAIHTAQSGIGDDTFDEIWLWFSNTDTVNRKLTVEFGGTGAGNLIEKTITAEDGSILIVPGWVLQNSAAVAAFAALTNVLNCHGFVNKVSP